MSLFGAYIHVKPNGLPFYVGKGRIERANRLDASHHNKHHNRIVQKYGRKNIGVGFISCSSEKIAFDLEIGLIKRLKDSGVILANITAGGEGVSGPKSKQHIANLSAALKGRPASFKGKKHTEESRKKMSQALVGRTSPRKGVVFTQEQKDALCIRVKKHWECDGNRQIQRNAAKSQMKQITVCGMAFESIHAYCLYTNRALSTVSRWVKKGWQHKLDHAYLEAVNAI